MSSLCMQSQISKKEIFKHKKIDVSATKFGNRIPIMVSSACSMYTFDQKFSICPLILFIHILSL